MAPGASEKSSGRRLWQVAWALTVLVETAGFACGWTGNTPWLVPASRAIGAGFIAGKNGVPWLLWGWLHNCMVLFLRLGFGAVGLAPLGLFGALNEGTLGGFYAHEAADAGLNAPLFVLALASPHGLIEMPVFWTATAASIRATLRIMLALGKSPAATTRHSLAAAAMQVAAVLKDDLRSAARLFAISVSLLLVSALLEWGGPHLWMERWYARALGLPALEVHPVVLRWARPRARLVTSVQLKWVSLGLPPGYREERMRPHPSIAAGQWGTGEPRICTIRLVQLDSVHADPLMGAMHIRGRERSETARWGLPARWVEQAAPTANPELRYCFARLSRRGPWVFEGTFVNRRHAVHLRLFCPANDLKAQWEELPAILDSVHLPP